MDESWRIAFDDYKMVWKNFSQNDYATLFAEDHPDTSTFNYDKKLDGFRQIPVDHYLRPFWPAPYWSPVSRRSAQYCYDELPYHQIHLGHLESFIKTYEKMRHFSFWWTQDMSHDYLNRAGMMDDDLVAFLERNERRLEDAVLVVFSDHGNRYDKIRETIQGRLESRLPFLSIRIPVKLKGKFPFLEKRLLENVGRMTSPFDIHEMINDIAWGTFIKEREVQGAKRPRGYSLFQEIPRNRSCLEASIPEHFCPCFEEKPVDEAEARSAAEVLLSRLNQLLATAPVLEENASVRCSPFQLDSIQSASIRLPPSSIVQDPTVFGQVAAGILQVQYRVVLKAKPPSSALLEGIAIKDFSTKEWTTTNDFERNNVYGNSSACVKDPLLKKLCHCVTR